MLAVSAQAKKAMIDDLGSAAFMVDLTSMERETQYTRTGDLAPTLVARALRRTCSILVSASRIAAAKAGWS